ncbi:MAG TPA: nucleotide sugar dehydrogenase [Gaiellaceae bacterium]
MTDVPKTLTVVGLGKLGSPMVACLASKGFDVIGVDVDEQKVATIGDGHAPVFEPQLGELLAENRERISATTDLGAAVLQSDLTFIVVATPSDENGGFSLKWVLPACETIGAALAEKDGFHTVVLTSTVMPGSTEAEVVPALERASGKTCGVDFGVCYSPEFIALGSVIRDFLHPDFLLVGESDDRAGAMLEALYRRVVETDAPVARMSFVNAELAKLSVNTFVTTKIAYANMLARMCERLPGADVDVVTDAIGLDTRIGRKYLRGAISYGGPCFPRDNVALATLARELGAPAFVAEATDSANRDGIERLADLAETRIPDGGTVAVLGLSYKPNTDVVEEAPGMLLVRALARRGVDVVAYDPAAARNAERALAGAGRIVDSIEDAVAEADAVVIATAWDEFRQLDPERLARSGKPRVVIDCWRLLPRESFAGTVEYVELGKGELTPERVAQG